jgi:hypothetical protein
MRWPTVASLFWLSLCACATAPVEPRGPEPFPARPPREPKAPRDRGTPPLAPTAARPDDGLARLLLDGPVEGCSRFAVVACDRTRTRFLILRIDADHLELAAGDHDLSIDGRFVAAEYQVFAAATDVPPCVRVREQPKRLQRWKATAGTVKLAWSDEPKRGATFPLAVELVDVDLVEDDGRTQRISARLPEVQVGTKPRPASAARHRLG